MFSAGIVLLPFYPLLKSWHANGNVY